MVLEVEIRLSLGEMNDKSTARLVRLLLDLDTSSMNMFICENSQTRTVMVFLFCVAKQRKETKERGTEY